jgi:hypothetical protein
MTIELYYREQSINRLHNRDCYREMVSKMKELPWPIYKIKLGTRRHCQQNLENILMLSLELMLTADGG